jgi:hypothetical protein
MREKRKRAESLFGVPRTIPRGKVEREPGITRRAARCKNYCGVWKAYVETIFEEELNGWYRLESAWPSPRTFCVSGLIHSRNHSTNPDHNAFNPRLTHPGNIRRMTHLSSDRLEQRGYCPPACFRRKIRTDEQFGQHTDGTIAICFAFYRARTRLPCIEPSILLDSAIKNVLF